jgi:cardiolipin synthase A/B
MLADVTVSTTFLVVALLAIVAQSVVLIVALFGPGLRYRVNHADLQGLEPHKFLHNVEALTDARLSQRTRLEVFTNGERFYPAELEAIQRASSSINLEAYIFQPGEVGGRFITALAERARAGVEVRVVLDGVGSAATTEAGFRPVLDAGGRLAFYHPLRFSTVPRYNHRTHRELLVIDGRVAFVGGAGISDHWLVSTPGRHRWRDTVVRLEGRVVNNLQATFAENWLESCGELLVGERHFPECDVDGDTPAMVVNSTPSAGGSTRARVLFQMLLASARHAIHVTTPYFLPDRGVTGELRRAVERGVDVRILVPGKHNDHLLTRSSSRMAYGRLLEHGVRIFEYEPSMLHAKILLIDGTWSVIGSTNFDNRSFGLNDEVNVAICDGRFAARLEEDFAKDLAEAREIRYAEWKGRSIFERGPELLGWILERQQ